MNKRSPQRWVLPKFTLKGACARALSGVSLFVFSACGATEDPATEEVVAETSAALVDYDFVEWTEVFYDDSAAPLHMAVTRCESLTVARSHDIICGSHPNYALVGGGVDVWQSQGTYGALVTKSYAKDNYFWRGRSQDLNGASNHKLRVYAIGIRLDGVNTQELRERIGNYVSAAGSSLDISAVLADRLALGGGFRMPDNAFVKGLLGNAGTGFTLDGDNHGTGVTGSTSLIVPWLSKRVFEDFGALELQQRTSDELPAAGANQAGIQGGVTSGWALVGVGGSTRATSGPGRLIEAFYPWDARHPTMSSVPHGGNSPGQNRLFQVEARKVPSSHGLCTTGTPLSTGMDWCIANICAQRNSCCSTTWDSTCVSMVSSVCSRSCSDYQCAVPGFSSSWWIADKDQTNSPRTDANCYGYALNIPDNRQPATSHYGFAERTVEGFKRGVAADGLLPTTRTGTCPNNGQKLAAFLRNDGGDYHFLRRDSNGIWSHKRTGSAPKTTDHSNNTIYDPETADLTESATLSYNTFVGYFCSCSGSSQGTGKERTAYAPQYDGWPSPWVKALYE